MTPLRDTGKLKDQRRQCGYRDTPMPGFILVAGLPVGDGTLQVVLLIWAGCDTFTVAGRCVAISEIPPIGIVKLVSCLVAARIGGRDRCVVVVQGTPVPAGDHRPLRVAVPPVPAELS